MGKDVIVITSKVNKTIPEMQNINLIVPQEEIFVDLKVTNPH